MYNTVSQLYNGLLGICFDKNNELSDPKRNKINHKYEPKKVSFKTYNYDLWPENEKPSDTTRKSDKKESANFVDLSETPSLEVDAQVKLEPQETIAKRLELNPQKRKNTGTKLKILTPNKLLTRFPILLTQIKAGHNSFKFKN